MITRTSLKARTYKGEEDLQPLVDLINACDAVDQVHENTDIDSLRVQVNQPGYDPQRDAHIWEDDQGRVMAFISVFTRPDETSAGGYLYWQVHPEVRESGIEDEIFAWAAERVKESGQELGLPGDLRSFAEEANAYASSQLEAQGFKITRYFFEMRRPLDDGTAIPEPQFPEGYTLRHVANDEDVERWVEMFNLSFIDHWDFHPITVERRKHRMTSAYYRPDHDLVAVAPDGTFAAFCLCSIDDEHNKRNNLSDGWIAVLGTRRGFRKIGLGRAMLIAGLHKLKENNVATAVLGVDAENPTGALGLYESAGFYKAKTAMAYHKEL
ncbi:MAG TPA: GNAT family N-acetyltransferase [Chloroflexia bacterium]|nr:GNAT family N-acetyltransferase [Chloroflexia bacterium]